MALATKSYTLDALADDVRAALSADSGKAGKEKVCGLVSRALLDEEFITEHLKDRSPGEHPREVLYEDDSGFCICGHVYDGEANGEAHDHGSSWAIYGQAVGETEMTDWKIVERGDGQATPHLVEKVKTYTMKPGDAHYYAVGDVHSPKRSAPVKLIRIEGANLDHVQRSNIKEK